MYQDQLITINQAARLLPKVNGKPRHYTVVERWCAHADIIESYKPKMVYKSVFLELMRELGVLPRQPITLAS